MMKCDFCGLPHPTAVFVHPVSVGTSWAACLECHLLIQGGHFLPLVERAVAVFTARGVRAVGGQAITEELRRQTERWLHEQFWSRRTGVPALRGTRSTFHEPGYCVRCGRMLDDDDGRCPVHG